jgi:hypothetical protein
LITTYIIYDFKQEAYSRNLEFDTVPNPILDSGDPLKLRERDKSKEIVSAMRHRPRISMERLYDSITDRGTSNNTDKIAEKVLKAKMKQFKEDPLS